MLLHVPPPVARRGVVAKISRAERKANKLAREAASADLERRLNAIVDGWATPEMIAELEAHLETSGKVGVIDGPLKYGELEAQISTAIDEGFRDALGRGLRIGQRYSGIPGVKLDPKIATQNAVKWIETTGAERVVGITGGMRQSVRSYLSEQITDKMSPTVAARKIGRVVGLDERGMRALDKFEADLVRRRIPIPEADTPAVRRAIAQETERYRQRLLRDRGRRIAETETQVAIHQGEKQWWDQAVSEGHVERPESAQKRWYTVADGSVCEHCAPLHGKIAPVDGLFATPLGPASDPPLHVRCRCFLERSADGFGGPPPAPPATPEPQSVSTVGPVAPEAVSPGPAPAAPSPPRPKPAAPGYAIPAPPPEYAGAVPPERLYETAVPTGPPPEPGQSLGDLMGRHRDQRRISLKPIDIGGKVHREQLALAEDAVALDAPLEEEQVSALRGYKDQDYKRINEGIRNGFEPPEAETIRSAMSRSLVNDDIVVWRGIGDDDGRDSPLSEALMELHIGDELPCRGFQSTTTARRAAEEFETRTTSGKPILLKIHLQRGTGAVYMDSAQIAVEGIAPEGEILLSDRGKYRIRDMAWHAAGPRSNWGTPGYLLEVDYIPESAEAVAPSVSAVGKARDGNGRRRGGDRERAGERLTMSTDELLASLVAGGHQAALDRYEAVHP